VGSSGSERAVDELPTPTGTVATIDVSRAEGDTQADGSGGKSFWMVRPEESGKLLDAHQLEGNGGLGQPEKTMLVKLHELERARTEVVDKAVELGESDTNQRELVSALTRKSSRRALQSRVLKMAAGRPGPRVITVTTELDRQLVAAAWKDRGERYGGTFSPSGNCPTATTSPPNHDGSDVLPDARTQRSGDTELDSLLAATPSDGGRACAGQDHLPAKSTYAEVVVGATLLSSNNVAGMPTPSLPTSGTDLPWDSAAMGHGTEGLLRTPNPGELSEPKTSAREMSQKRRRKPKTSKAVAIHLQDRIDQAAHRFDVAASRGSGVETKQPNCTPPPTAEITLRELTKEGKPSTSGKAERRAVKKAKGAAKEAERAVKVATKKIANRAKNIRRRMRHCNGTTHVGPPGAVADVISTRAAKLSQERFATPGETKAGPTANASTNLTVCIPRPQRLSGMGATTRDIRSLEGVMLWARGRKSFHRRSPNRATHVLLDSWRGDAKEGEGRSFEWRVPTEGCDRKVTTELLRRRWLRRWWQWLQRRHEIRGGRSRGSGRHRRPQGRLIKRNRRKSQTVDDEDEGSRCRELRSDEVKQGKRPTKPCASGPRGAHSGQGGWSHPPPPPFFESGDAIVREAPKRRRESRTSARSRARSSPRRTRSASG